MEDTQHQPVAKRRKLDPSADPNARKTLNPVKSPLLSLSRSITPPGASQKPQALTRVDIDLTVDDGYTSRNTEHKLLPSPVQLTCIRDLPPSSNVDTVGLREILGDPMIRECWQFNYLFDIDFLM